MARVLNLNKLREIVMAIALFDTLKFCKRLKEAGVPSAQAHWVGYCAEWFFSWHIEVLAG